MTESANARRAFTAEDVFRLKQVSDPQLSPDGSKVAYVVTSADAEADEFRTHIWVAPLDGREPRQITRGSQKNSSPRWSPDGTMLAFVSNRSGGKDGKDDKEKRNQIWLIGENGEPWQLTDTVKGASSPAWSPDSKKLLFLTRSCTDGETVQADKKTPREKNLPRVLTELVYRFDGEGHFDETFTHVWTIAATGGEPVQVTSGDFSDGEAAWSPDGREILYTSNREPDHGEAPRRRDVWVVAATGGQARKLTASKGPCSMPAWSPDGSTIAYAGHERGEGFSSATTLIYTVPVAGGETRALTESLDRPVSGLPAGTGLAWTPDGQAILFLGQDAGASRLYRVPAAGGEAEPLTDTSRWVSALSVASDGSAAVFSCITPTNPGELFLPSLSGGEPRQLTHHNADLLAEVELSQPEPLIFSGADGWQISAFLIKPRGYHEGQRYPLVLDIHGGPHGMHGQTFSPGFQELAARGYAVLLVNPRGSTGYGEAFTHACVDDWGGKDYEDLMLGVDRVIELGIADPERTVVTGYSYGGFMTSWVVGHTNRFKAAVCGAPVSDLVSFYGTSDIGATFGQFELGGPLWERFDEYRAHSPLYYIHNCTTPFMLMHWDGDLRCPIGQSEELFAVLKRLHREAVFVRYPGAFHTYVTHAPSQRVDALQRTGEWFDSHLVATAAPERQPAGVAGGN